MFRNVRGLTALLLLLAGCCAGFRISQPDSKLKQKILELQNFQNFARTNNAGGVRDKRQSKPLETESEEIENTATELFGHKITDTREQKEVREESAEDKLLNRSARVVKKRRRRRFPRRSYGYEAPRGSYDAPQTSYEAPDVSTHRPSYPKKSAHKKKKKPFTSFRSISSSKATSAPSSYTTPSSYSAPSPPKTSYSSPSRKPNYSSKPKNTYKAPKSSYSSPPKSSYSSPPKSSYSSPPKSSYSSPPKSSYSSPPKPSYSSPKSSYSSPPKSSYSSPPKSSYSSPPKSSYSSPPKPSYSSPKSSYSSPPKSSYSSPKPSYSSPPKTGHSSPQASYSSAGDDSAPGEYSYHYSVPETESQAWEERTGYTTQGSYSVLLPDGRTMTVTYSVPDSETGFLAEVSFDGEPSYPEDTPSYRQPGYNRKREAKIRGAQGEKTLFQHFKALDNDDIHAEELGLVPEKSLKFLPNKLNDDISNQKTEDTNHDRKYPHFEEINTIHKIPQDTRVRFPSFESFTADPVSVFGEFPNLNPRQEHKEDISHERQTQEPERIFLEPSTHRLIGPLPLDHEDVTLPLPLPVPIPQKSYQTAFQYKQPIGLDTHQARPEEPYIKTSIQPFIFFQSQDSDKNVKTIDNVG